jgi:hypothetical protein
MNLRSLLCYKDIGFGLQSTNVEIYGSRKAADIELHRGATS